MGNLLQLVMDIAARAVQKVLDGLWLLRNEDCFLEKYLIIFYILIVWALLRDLNLIAMKAEITSL